MASNQQVKTAVAVLEDYRSVMTGEEIDHAVQESAAIRPFLDTNVIVPAASFLGDTLRKTITLLTKDMWLHSITLQCMTPFSKSVSAVRYEISTSNGFQLLAIPQAVLTTQDMTIEYLIDKPLPLNTRIDMVCSSTQAFGNLQVKLSLI